MNLSQDYANVRGRIFNVQRYCVHDGPGIRSIVFFSGCPLRCIWCCNPEAFIPNTTYTREINAREAAEWLLKDRSYYRKSKGGVTLSGGEPLMQVEFAKTLLEICQEHNIETAIETCGYVPGNSFDAVDGLVDYYLYDIKHMDEEAHRRYTGVGNRRIIENLQRLSLSGKNITLRLPLISDINTDKEEACRVGELIGMLNIAEVHLLPYHRLGEVKYHNLNVTYPLQGKPDFISDPEGQESIHRFAQIISRYIGNVYIGG